MFESNAHYNKNYIIYFDSLSRIVFQKAYQILYSRLQYTR